MNNIEEFNKACRALLANKDMYALNYAVGYASDGLGMTDPETIRVQCLYILNNMSGWRGDTATECRITFKRLSYQKAWTGVAA